MRWLLVLICCAGLFLRGTSSSIDAPVIEIVQDERIPEQTISEQNDDENELANNKLATGRPSLVEYPITGSPTTPRSPSAAVPVFSAGLAPAVVAVLLARFLV